MYKNFIEIDGIGLAKAKELVSLKIKISDLRGNPEKYANIISNETLLSLKYPVNRELPWEFVDTIINKLPNYFIGVGGYRRKKPILKDIDLLITNDIHKAVSDIKTGNYGLHVMGDYSDGEHKHSMIVKVDTPRLEGEANPIYIRMDIFKTEIENLPFALLHYTGSPAFNIRIRAYAKKQGYKLSQYGLFKMKNNERISVDKNITTERHILEFLNITYKSPSERIR